MTYNDKWLWPAERCDICNKSFVAQKHFINGKVKAGFWKIMCRDCHKIFGVGIGSDRGQIYLTETKEKVAG